MKVEKQQPEKPAAKTTTHAADTAKAALRQQLLDMIKRNEALRQSKPR